MTTLRLKWILTRSSDFTGCHVTFDKRGVMTTLCLKLICMRSSEQNKAIKWLLEKRVARAPLRQMGHHVSKTRTMCQIGGPNPGSICSKTAPKPAIKWPKLPSKIWAFWDQNRIKWRGVPGLAKNGKRDVGLKWPKVSSSDKTGRRTFCEQRHLLSLDGLFLFWKITWGRHPFFFFFWYYGELWKKKKIWADQNPKNALDGLFQKGCQHLGQKGCRDNPFFFRVPYHSSLLFEAVMSIDYAPGAFSVIRSSRLRAFFNRRVFERHGVDYAPSRIRAYLKRREFEMRVLDYAPGA